MKIDWQPKLTWSLSQDLWENLLKIMRDSEFKISAVTEAMVMIHNLYTEFVRTARFYAELLVREKFSEKKTVKVINVGGIAGTSNLDLKRNLTRTSGRLKNSVYYLSLTSKY